MEEKILTEITEICECCVEEECVLYKIEQIINDSDVNEE